MVSVGDIVNVIQTCDLSKKYGKFQALKNVNMHIQKGDIYGFVGKNGAGKTTLIRIICGLQDPTNGEYKLYDVTNRHRDIAVIRKKVGAIVEMPSLYLDCSAKENLRYQFEMLGNPDLTQIDDILKLVGLKETGKKKVKDFSLGMRQRLAIGLTLVGNPDLIVLDEPINGLDPEGNIEIRELILKLNHERGITFLISSHILDELAKLATRYGFIKDGNLIKEMTREELMNECRKSVLIETTDLKKSIVVYDELAYDYRILSENQVEINQEVDITDLVLELSKRQIRVKKIKEKDENLETYFMKLLGESQYD